MAYDTKNLKGDLSGGFVAGIIALPLALAFGVQSGLGAEAGLYGAIAVGIFAALLGGTATQASGPTGPMTVVSASIVVFATEATGSLEAGLGIALLSFFAGGLIQVGLGLAGVGKYIRYFPYPVVSGFMSGVGLIIVFLQVWPLLGSSSPKKVVEVFTRIGEPLGAINWSAVGLGVLTLTVNYVFPRVTKKVPSVLVALLVGTGVALIAGLDVPTIGEIPSGFPPLHVGTLFSVAPEHLGFILSSGVTLAVLGSIDSLLTAVIADNMTRDHHNSTRELVGQGIGNMIAAVFGGIPGAGATKGTVVAINAGAKTRLSGVTHGVFQLVVLLGAGSLAAHIPLSVLAGLLISVGLAIIDYKGIKHLLHVPKADGAVMVVVLVWTVFGNLIYAVAGGVVLASVLFMKRFSDLAAAETSLTQLEPEAPWEDERSLSPTDQVYTKHLYGPLFFALSASFRALSEGLPASTKILVIRMERVPYLDQSGLYALEDTVLRLSQKGTQVVLTGVAEQPLDLLRGIQLVPSLVREDQIFATFEECRQWLVSETGPQPSTEAPAAPTE